MQKLQEKSPLLIAYLTDNGYSKRYIMLFKAVIKSILNEAKKNDITYEKIYESLIVREASPSILRQRRSVIGLIKYFIINDSFLPPGKRSGFLKTDNYDLLPVEFKQIIDRYIKHERKRGKSEDTIYTESHNAACFLQKIHETGIRTIGKITEKSVLDFFYDGEKIIQSTSHKKNIAAVIRACIPDYHDGECERVLGYFPCNREHRKNYQFLTDKEVSNIKAILAENNPSLSLRNKAIGILAFYTGLRSCDISNLCMDDIDWKRDLIKIKQQKTCVSLTLPLRAVVGNVLLDYLVNERPRLDIRQIFLTENKPYHAIPSSSLYNVSVAILKQAGVRTEGGRKGLHLFRHHLASSLLENGVQHPVISSTLGHTEPSSLNPYLDTDLIHLKECALSVESFPVGKGVFV